MRAMSSQVRNSRSMIGTKRRWRRSSRSMRARSVSVSATMREKLSSVAATSPVCSATSSARQLMRLPPITSPLRSSSRPRGGAIRRAEMRLLSAIVV
jgi:hypothetical protein